LSPSAGDPAQRIPHIRPEGDVVAHKTVGLAPVAGGLRHALQVDDVDGGRPGKAVDPLQIGVDLGPQRLVAGPAQQRDDVLVQLERAGQEIVFGQQVLQAARIRVQPLRAGEPQALDRYILGIAIGRAGQRQAPQQQHAPRDQPPARPAAGRARVGNGVCCWHGDPVRFNSRN
jgi:hypothetical protein